MIHSDTIAGRTLLNIARRRPGFDSERCRVVFAHLDTAASLHGTLHRALAPWGLSDLKFDVLVVLHALAPESVTPAQLAAETAASRSAITEVVDQLVAQRLVSRKRGTADRRAVAVSLTSHGRATVEPAAAAYLHLAGDLGRFLAHRAQPGLLRAYARLQQGATRLAAAPPPSP